MTEPRKPETTRPIPTVKPGEGDAREVTRPTGVMKVPKATTQTARQQTLTGLTGRMDLRKITRSVETTGMAKHRRYVEKMKRKANVERLSQESDRAERWSRQQKVVLLVLMIAIGAASYYKVQSAYGNQWPIMTIWIAVVIAVLGCFFWTIWYIDKGDM